MCSRALKKLRQIQPTNKRLGEALKRKLAKFIGRPATVETLQAMKAECETVLKHFDAKLKHFDAKLR